MICYFLRIKHNFHYVVRNSFHNICWKFLETYSTLLCKDKEECSTVSPKSCQQFNILKNECPVACGLCRCEDTKDCSDISSELCNAYPSIKDKCRKTCGVCLDRKWFVQCHADTIYSNIILHDLWRYRDLHHHCKCLFII